MVLWGWQEKEGRKKSFSSRSGISNLNHTGLSSGIWSKTKQNNKTRWQPPMVQLELCYFLCASHNCHLVFASLTIFCKTPLNHPKWHMQIISLAHTADSLHMSKAKMVPAVEFRCRAKEVGLGSHGHNRPFDIFEPTVGFPLPQEGTVCECWELHSAVCFWTPTQYLQL